MLGVSLLNKVVAMSTKKDNSDQLIETEQFLKDRLQNDKITFFKHEEERRTMYDLLERTATYGESNIALLIGVRGSGKTSLVTSVLHSIISNPKLTDIVIVRLHGLVDTNDTIALKSITKQLQLEKEINEKVFGSFAEHLAFLLNCLKCGREKRSRSVVFILDDFHLFCDHTNQTLLYNLFDSAQSRQSPICVIGLTCRLDAVELLEKRVKSRFSHRQIILIPQDISFSDRLEIIRKLLSLPTQKENNSMESFEEFNKNNKLTWMRRVFDPRNYTFSSKWVSEWNTYVDEIMKNSAVIESFQLIHDYNATLHAIKKIIYKLVNGLDSSKLSVQRLQKICTDYCDDGCIKRITDLSVLEISILIAIKHHCEIYDHDPFNFEIIFTRLNKFLKTSRMNPYDRSVVLGAFEKLQHEALITPVNDTSSKVQKEFQMLKLNIMICRINKAVNKYPNLPTEISQWAQSSLV